MGLADLKKNSTPSSSTHRQIQTSQLALEDLIDDFINDASRYAIGQEEQAPKLSELVDLECHSQVELLTNLRGDKYKVERLAEKVLTVKKGKLPVRKATFTLTESAIAHLAELADDCDVAKSKLIRFLIEHHFNLSPEQRRAKEKSIIVE
ncbi:CopG family transcriptional regulator [Shewanella schlegeliana]|uniref:CopG family transcriptional regulator n=1 Tax=Shewanella schlegeliana TaxID=190308 RepID=A0ABS1SZY2_9GAMM|nr:CopG family transcriptional regulator [Shewanella schlegeliana]MBL4914088.1 CopG family transcriptional regulator [Shewanella schlegeliana]MCL1110874.1 CopG family transcriptional regulator [Shewanella schlegeliana]GIU34673.1 CopG family transcriptional regulator [Shewanella schlegeliana]